VKAKTIKSILSKKFADWAASIKDPQVKEMAVKGSIITGGAITSLLMNEEVNDYDIYFTTPETAEAVATYYVELFKKNPPSKFKSGSGVDISVKREGDRVKIVVQSQGIASEGGSDDYQYFEQIPNPDTTEPHDFVAAAVEVKSNADSEGKEKYRPVFVSSNAISLSDDIQIVIRFTGSVVQIHENYDFIHCTCSWEASSGELLLPNEALLAILNKDLVYKTSRYPLCSMIRTRKFLARGWRINAGQYVKMAWDLNKLDLSDPKVLEDQMVGVDSAYFQQVIELLKAKSPDKVDGTYLIQIIDQIF
jgi:hypothetical protein